MYATSTLCTLRLGRGNMVLCIFYATELVYLHYGKQLFRKIPIDPFQFVWWSDVEIPAENYKADILFCSLFRH